MSESDKLAVVLSPGGQDSQQLAAVDIWLSCSV